MYIYNSIMNIFVRDKVHGIIWYLFLFVSSSRERKVQKFFPFIRFDHKKNDVIEFTIYVDSYATFSYILSSCACCSISYVFPKPNESTTLFLDKSDSNFRNTLRKFWTRSIFSKSQCRQEKYSNFTLFG